MTAAKQTATPKSAFDFDMNNAFTQFKIPGFDIEAIMATQRKNIEAAAAANQRAFEGMSALVQRQTEVAREVAEGATKAMTDLSAAAPEQRVAKQADYAKSAIEAFMTNGREMFDMASKTADEASALVNARITATLDEGKAAAAAATK